jgi:hypothetical protein
VGEAARQYEVDGATVELEILQRTPGRVVLADAAGIHIGRNYAIRSSQDQGRSWQEVGRLPLSPLRRAADVSRMACRLLRQEVRALARTGEGRFVAANRQGVFHCDAPGATFEASRVDTGPLPLMPPMRFCVGPDDSVLFGEYGSSKGARPVRLYGSRDGGRSFSLLHALVAGDVLHVHNLRWDESQGHYWVMAGDHDAEPGIGCLSADLARFEWFVKGEQRYRACEVFDFGDRLVYASDTEVEKNGLMTLDKRSGQVERLRDFDGSCIYACRFGDLYALTTSIEPSPVNTATAATLWLSRDGFEWKAAFRGEKDGWNADFFQFGSIVLPSGCTADGSIVFSGQAVRGIDGETIVARLAEGAVL